MAISEPGKQTSQPVTPSGASRLVLFLAVFIDLLGFGIVIPFLPMYAQRLKIGAFGVGVILAIYSLMQFLCAPVLGRISDRVGRRPIIMLGLLGSSVSYIIYGFANSFLLLFLSRAAHGVCAGTIATAQAYVADTTSEADRAQGMGMIGAAFGLGFVLGPALGGLLGHSSLQTPVFFASALTFANLIFAALYLPESHCPEPGVRLGFARMIEPLFTIPRQLVGHRLARLFSVAFLLTFTIAALEATFALMVPRIYGYGAFGVGGLLAFAGLVQAVVQGYLLGKVARHTGELWLIRIGTVALAVGMAPLGSWSSRAALVILLGMVSLGYGFGSPSVASLISKRTDSRLQGEVLGVNQSALSLARISGPIAGGLIYELLGPSAPYMGGALVAVLALLLTRGIDSAAA